MRLYRNLIMIEIQRLEELVIRLWLLMKELGNGIFCERDEEE